MGRTRSTLIIVGLLATAMFAGCSSEDELRETRSSHAVDLCRSHGGVVAFDDETVICRDETTSDARAASAVAACRRHEGVAALEDDIVICRDQTSQVAEGG